MAKIHIANGFLALHELAKQKTTPKSDANVAMEQNKANREFRPQYCYASKNYNGGPFFSQKEMSWFRHLECIQNSHRNRGSKEHMDLHPYCAR